jgi:hypothetical protein
VCELLHMIEPRRIRGRQAHADWAASAGQFPTDDQAHSPASAAALEGIPGPPPLTCKQLFPGLVGAYGFDPHHSARALIRLGVATIYFGGVADVRDRGMREMIAKASGSPSGGGDERGQPARD